MVAVANRVAEWVGITEDLLRGPMRTFPFHRINGHLLTSFHDAEVVAFSWQPACSGSGVAVETRAAGGATAPRAEAIRTGTEQFVRDGLLPHHPLVRWFATTGQSAAQTMGRLPAVFADSPRIGELYERLDESGLRQQLSLPVLMSDGAHEAFVLARSGRNDFPIQDVTVAHRIQGLLGALRSQADVLRVMDGAQRVPPGDLLTGRECAVLTLLVDGCTATAIGHRLAMSPRTADKHVQNIYRKLEVRDRVTAARVAESLGFVAPPVMRAAGSAPR